MKKASAIAFTNGSWPSGEGGDYLGISFRSVKEHYDHIEQEVQVSAPTVSKLRGLWKTSAVWAQIAHLTL